jgi:hypothetical protein
MRLVSLSPRTRRARCEPCKSSPNPPQVSGNKFYYLRNAGAMLELALVNYAFNKVRSCPQSDLAQARSVCVGLPRLRPAMLA